jgi:hypothetical protein
VNVRYHPRTPLETYTAPAALRAKRPLRRLAVHLVLGACLAAVGAHMLKTPTAKAAQQTWSVRQAVRALPFKTIAGDPLQAGVVTLALPKGATLNGSAYRFQQDLVVKGGRKAHLAFELTGLPAGVPATAERGRGLGLPGGVGYESHGQKAFKALHYRLPAIWGDHARQMAGFYEFQNRSADVFGLAVYYRPETTHAEAMAALIDRILGSVIVQEVG